MVCEEHVNTIENAYEVLQQNGLEGMPEAMQLLLNTAMKLERQEHMGISSAYERSAERVDSGNGFKPKTVTSRLGELHLQVPKTRNGDFYPSCLEKGVRSERALTLAIAQMYVQGVSTRKVAHITESLIGKRVTSEQVSQAAKQLDEQLSAWRERPLSSTGYDYIYLDALYENVREGGAVLSQALMVAVGVRQEGGKREILGLHLGHSESEVNWRDFLKALQARGLSGIKLFTSDDHAGLKAARKAVFPAVPWQRCQFHLQQNAQAYVPKADMREEVAEDIRDIFNAPKKKDATERLAGLIKKYEKKAPKLADWVEENIPEGLTCFQFPKAHRKRIRTSNVLERVNKEIRRRTRVLSIFPNADSCIRLATAILIEVSEDWLNGMQYLDMTIKMEEDDN